jgi:hypothetical protein
MRGLSAAPVEMTLLRVGRDEIFSLVKMVIRQFGQNDGSFVWSK